MRHISTTKRLALRVLMACTVGALTGATEHALDAALLSRGFASMTVLVDDYFTALLVAAIAFCFSLYLDERHRRQKARHRVTALAEMNHHLRNALAVLKLSPEIEDSDARRRAIESGVARIEFTLKEILPSTFEHRGEPRYFVGPQHQD